MPIDSTGINKSKTSKPFFCTHVICYLKATPNDRFLDDKIYEKVIQTISNVTWINSAEAYSTLGAVYQLIQEYKNYFLEK